MIGRPLAEEQEVASSSKLSNRRMRGGTVTFRAIVLGLIGIPPCCLWLVQIEYIRYSDTPTIAALFFHCIALLVGMVAVNRLIRRIVPRLEFSPVELLTIYAMLVIASNLCGHDVLQILFTTIAWFYKHITPENRWGEIIRPVVPAALLPRPGQALDALFAGQTDLVASGYWRAWIVPLSLWAAFVLVLTGTMFCGAAILRRQWDHERLTYPLQEIPLAVAHPESGLFRSRLFWIAALGAGGLQMLNLSHSLWPWIPAVPLAPQYLTPPSLPWSAAGSIPICYYPFAVGLTFLLPTQLAFSCLFFFVFTRLELVATAAAGEIPSDHSLPFVQQQGAGAYLAYALITLWMARRHVAAAWRQAWHGDGEPDDGEPMAYRTAFVGLAAGSVLMIAFLVSAGMELRVAAAYFVLLALIVLCVSRLRAEIGLPSIELYQRGADDILIRSFGSSAFTRRDLTVESMLFFLNRTHRQFPMMHHFDQLRIARAARADMRRFATAIGLATVAGVICAFWSMLSVTYRIGLASAHMTGPAGWAFGNDPWNRLASWIQSARPAEPGSVAAYGVGIAITCALAVLRTRFFWWPLHPAGFVVGASFSLMRLWLPLFTSWVLKCLILRYGGLKGYRTALPFFMGLVIGEFSAGFLRTVLDLMFRLYLPVDSGIGGL